MSGLLRDSGGVARDVEPAAAVALARSCASAAPGPTALGVTRFFLQKVEKCVSLKRKNHQLGMLGRRGGIPPASGPDHSLVVVTASYKSGTRRHVQPPKPRLVALRPPGKSGWSGYVATLARKAGRTGERGISGGAGAGSRIKMQLGAGLFPSRLTFADGSPARCTATRLACQASRNEKLRIRNKNKVKTASMCSRPKEEVKSRAHSPRHCPSGNCHRALPRPRRSAPCALDTTRKPGRPCAW